MSKKKINPKDAMKVFFTTSVAAFSIVESVSLATGKPMDEKTKEMQKLHREALEILENSENWASELQAITNRMEFLASLPNSPKSKFKRGGIHSTETQSPQLPKESRRK